MRWQCMLIGLICVLMPLTVSAEFYRYTDENGVIHFTDNFIEIPKNLQSSAQSLTDPDDALTPEELTEKKRPKEAVVNKKSEAEIKAEQKQRFEALSKTKADLDKIYAELAKEKEALEKEKETVKTAAAIKALQQKVTRFNQRLADYEKQRTAFQEKADAYNKEIAQ